MRILVIEDDEMIARGLQTALGQEGHAVDCAKNAHVAATAMQSFAFDLILLDLGLPGKDGIELLRDMRRHGNPIPVIIVTARDELRHRVDGLDAGADDYIVKPFDLDEVTARIRSVVRRSDGRGEPVIRHRDISLDPATHSVQRDGKAVVVSAHEYAVLEALLRRPGAILSRAQLEDRLYGWDKPIESNAVEVYVHALRRKLGADAIRTLRGVGYFVPKQ